MDKLKIIILSLITRQGTSRKIVMSLAVAVVFVTTYLLILPAITLDRDEAVGQGGIDVPEITAESEDQLEDSIKLPVAEENKEPAESVPEADHAESETLESEGTEAESAEPDSTDSEEEKPAAKGASFEQSVLTDDGKNYRVTVEYSDDAGVPDGAALEVSEIKQEKAASDTATEYETYLEKTQEALGAETTAFDYIRIFDIRIVDKDGSKVTITAPVDVKIELADKDKSKEAEQITQIVHFADGSESGEVVENVDVDGKTVSFEAEGFSVYSIVEAPDPVTVDPKTVKTLLELSGNTDKAFYLSIKNPPQYFTSSLNENNCFIESSNIADAADWYFEPSEDADAYYIYTLIDGAKQYIKRITGGTGNDVELVSAREDATVLSADADNAMFQFKSGDRTLQHSNRGGGIRFYKDGDANNINITITYAASTVLPDDPYGLNDKTYGIAYHNDSAAAGALMAEVKDDKHLVAEDMVMREDVLDNDGVLLVAPDSDITEWHFVWVSEDRYYIKTGVGDTEKYLTLTGDTLTLSDSPEENSKFRAIPGTGENKGKYQFAVNNYAIALNLSGNDTSKGFWGSSASTAAKWLNLVEKAPLGDDDFKLYSAKKVSVSDTVNVYDGQQVVIYTRIWNESKKKYEFFAVDHDGSLVRCYDTGDNIEWTGTQVNTLLWNFYEGKNADGSFSYYYWLQNDQYKDEYIAPQRTNSQTVISGITSEQDFKASINLNGRRYGDNYTTIIAWDDDQYSYSGLKTENGHVVPCKLSESEDFYFAVINPIDEDDKLTTVATIDSTKYGITMKMVDFNNPIQNVNGGTATNSNGRDSGQTAVLGYNTNAFGLVSSELGEDGYPQTVEEKTGKESQSLGVLFGSATEVNQLFIQSIYNESGYFEYDSTQNFAHLNDDGTFTVYDQIGTVSDYNAKTTWHGQFFPYNNLTAGKYCSDKANTTSVLAEELPDTNARKGEKLYNVGKQNDIDYFFGMQMEASFTQTANGLDAWGHDIIFEFSGDDDFWLYVDNELILDVGGVHSASIGKINFRTGVVEVVIRTVEGKTDRSYSTTLRELFKEHYKEKHSEASEAEVEAYLDDIFILKDGNYVFKDYSNHTMKMFYMERGSGASNLHMRFNLASVRPGTFVLSKELSGTDEASNDLIEFPYQVWYESRQTGRWTTLSDTGLVHYLDSTKEVKYAATFTPAEGTEAYDNVFFLKPGEAAEVEIPEDAVDGKYYVVECGVNPDVYDHVFANGDELTGTPTENKVGETSREDYQTTTESTDDRKTVTFTNHVSDGAMRTLEFKKNLYDADGSTELHYSLDYDRLPDDQKKLYDNTTFTFRLYLANENVTEEEFSGSNRNNYYANLYTYHIKDEDGNYCRWDAGSKVFVSIGKADYGQLTEEEKEAVSFTTSMYGSISRIPAWYTVEVRGLIAGTHYMVEERDWELPKGYTRWADKGYARVDADYYIEQSEPYIGITHMDETPQLEVRNQRGWGLTAKKIWTDTDFMSQHDDIYFAVYLDGTLYPETVHRLASGESEIYYYFPDLYGITAETKDTTYQFTDYVFREVKLTPNDGVELYVDENTGEVKAKLSDGTLKTISDDSFVKVNRIEEGDTLTTGGTPVGGTHQDGYEYTALYETGTPSGYNANIRVDKVTNSRPGLKLFKMLWDGKTPLEGTVFTLKDADDNDVAARTYTSDDTGLITIAYLNPGTYTLAEIETPKGYVALETPMIIHVGDDENHTLSVSGPDQEFYVLNQASESEMASITIKNRSVELQVKKTDASTGNAIAGVHFALYRQVTDEHGSRPDYTPISGFEDIVTGEDGVLRNIDLTSLTWGTTYYIKETAAAEDYEILEEYICFKVGMDGKVTISSSGHETWVTHGDDADGNTAYLINIPNEKLKNVSFKKVDVANINKVLEGAVFDLYQVIEIDGEMTERLYLEGLISGEDGMLSKDGVTVFQLPHGVYHMKETKAPDGYILDGEAVVITIGEGNNENAVSYDDGTTLSKSGGGVQYNNETKTYTLLITNSAGVELPHTGGIGTTIFYMLGTLLAAGCGMALLRRRRKTN